MDNIRSQINIWCAYELTSFQIIKSNIFVSICSFVSFILAVFVYFCFHFYSDFVSLVSAILDPHSFVWESAAPHCLCISFTCPSLVLFVLKPPVFDLWVQIVLAYLASPVVMLLQVLQVLHRRNLFGFLILAQRLYTFAQCWLLVYQFPAC